MGKMGQKIRKKNIFIPQSPIFPIPISEKSCFRIGKIGKNQEKEHFYLSKSIFPIFPTFPIPISEKSCFRIGIGLPTPQPLD